MLICPVRKETHVGYHGREETVWEVSGTIGTIGTDPRYWEVHSNRL